MKNLVKETLIAERLNRKEIEAEIRANAKKEKIELSDKTREGHYMNFGVDPLGKKSFDTLLQKCSLDEAISLLKSAFEDASEKLDLPVDELYITRAWRQGAVITGQRDETDEEFESRIQDEIDKKLQELKTTKRREYADKKAKQKKIEQLNAELAQLNSELNKIK